MVFPSGPAGHGRRLLQEYRQSDQIGRLHRRRRPAAHRFRQRAVGRALRRRNRGAGLFPARGSRRHIFRHPPAAADRQLHLHPVEHHLRRHDDHRPRPAAGGGQSAVRGRRPADRPVGPSRQPPGRHRGYGQPVASDLPGQLRERTRDRTRADRYLRCRHRRGSSFLLDFVLRQEARLFNTRLEFKFGSATYRGEEFRRSTATDRDQHLSDGRSSPRREGGILNLRPIEDHGAPACPPWPCRRNFCNLASAGDGPCTSLCDQICRRHGQGDRLPSRQARLTRFPIAVLTEFATGETKLALHGDRQSRPGRVSRLRQRRPPPSTRRARTPGSLSPWNRRCSTARPCEVPTAKAQKQRSADRRLISARGGETPR